MTVTPPCGFVVQVAAREEQEAATQARLRALEDALQQTTSRLETARTGQDAETQDATAAAAAAAAAEAVAAGVCLA